MMSTDPSRPPIPAVHAALSRRDLLRAAAALTLGTASLGSDALAQTPTRVGGAAARPWPGLALPAGPAAPPLPLAKGISMASYAPLRDRGHPNDYLLHGNREYIRDLSGTRWVKLWVSWAHLQEELVPASRAESWRQLNTAPGGSAALRYLDHQIRAVNDDALAAGGLGVILTVYHEYPTWASEADEQDPARGERAVNGRVPRDCGPASPWGWFIAHLCARYAPGAPANPSGPREPEIGSVALSRDARRGNPAGARVDVLEVVNEPNLLLWPQDGLPEKVAQMLGTAVELSAALGGPPVAGPALSDFPDEPVASGRLTDWEAFASSLLAALPPELRFLWSHHNYLDTSEEVSLEGSRVRALLGLLEEAGWSGEQRRIWLTEGGYDLFPEQDDPRARRLQAALVTRSFAEMARTPEVATWTQHVINDVAGNTFKSGLRDEFVPGAGPGPPRPLFDVWRRLDGRRA